LWNLFFENSSVYRSDSENGFYIQINPTLVFDRVLIGGDLYQQYKDSGLINGITYWYKVTAVSNSGVESTPSTAVSGVPTAKVGGDFRIEVLEISQVVSVGHSVTFHITIIAEDKFNETVTLSATSEDLPAQVVKTFSHADVQPTGSTTLNVIAPHASDPGDYTIKIDANSATRSHETYLQLKIVNLGNDESLITAMPNKDVFRLGEKVYILGQLLPWQPTGTSVEIYINPPGEDEWTQYSSQINDQGVYRFEYEPTALGDYQVKASWAGNQNVAGDESEIFSIGVGKGQSQLRCSTTTQNIEPGVTVAIQIELKPKLSGVPFHLDILKHGQETPEPVTGLSTEADGKLLYYYTLDQNLPGIWKFKASWAGNNEYVGAISLPLVLYPGVEVGEALIVAGGGITNNTLWTTTEYLANRFYRVLKSRRFTHDQITYMSPHTHNYDFEGDGVDDIIIDDNNPSVFDIQTYLEALYPTGQNPRVDESKPLIIYLVDHGGVGKFKVNLGNEYLLASDFDGWLDTLQTETSCKVVVIVEACHSGTFIQELTPTGNQERILISSSNTEVSNYDQTGIQSFSQIFLDMVGQGDNIRNCFYKAKEKLSNRYLFVHQNPQLNDGQQGLIATNFYIGGTFLVGDIMPDIIAATPNQAIDAGVFGLFASVTDVEGIDDVWVSIMPPNFVVPETIQEFETPVISLDKVDLADQDDDSTYGGNYDFKYNGTYVLTFFARDTGGNVVSQEVRLTVENGVDPIGPGDVSGDGNVDLADVILALQVSCGVDTGSDVIYREADVNNDGRIGLAEAIHALRVISEIQ